MRQIQQSLAGLAVLGMAWGGSAMAEGLTYDGFVELEYIDGDTFSSDVWISSELRASLDLGSGFGLDFGLNTAIGNNVFGQQKVREAVYAAAGYTFGQHKLSLGVPVPAIEDMINLPVIGGNHAFESRSVDFVTGNTTNLLYLRSDGDIPYGLRYDGDFGAFRLGASGHYFSDQDVESYNIAASYDILNYNVFGGFETATGGRETDMWIVGASADYGAVTGGLAYFNRDFRDGSNPETDGTRAWLDYKPIEELTVGATAVNTNQFDVYGMSMKYQLPIGAYAQMGAVDGRGVGRVYDLSVGFKF